MSEEIERYFKYSPEFKIRLIELIEKQPLIYETPIKRLCTTERETSWEEIGRKLNTSVAECKSAWHLIRRRYIPYLLSNSYKTRGPFSNRIFSRLKFLLPYLKKKNLSSAQPSPELSPAPATSSSTDISMMNEEGLSTTPTVLQASTNSTITTDSAMSTVVLVPIVASRPEVSSTSTAPTSLSSKISKTKKVRRSSSTTSTSNAGSKSTVINISTPGMSSMDIKVNPLLFVPSYTQENNSENSDTFFVTHDIIQQLLESKEKDEKQSDFINDNKCITIDEGFIENPYNNQTTTTLSSNSCVINRNNMATDPVSDKSLSMDKTDENIFLAENLTSSARTISEEMKKQDIESTFQIEPTDNKFNTRIKNYFLCMADRMAGLPQDVQEGICLNISETIDHARFKYLND